MNLYKALNVERGNWTSNNTLWDLYGKNGIQLSDYYLNLLLELCSKNNIKFSLSFTLGQIKYIMNKKIMYILNFGLNGQKKKI